MKKMNLLSVLLVLSFLSTPLFAEKVKEGDARSATKKSENEYSKFKSKKIGDFAPKIAIQIEKYIDEANKQIAEEEWEAAYYNAGKAMGFIELGYAVKLNEDWQAKLKSVQKLKK